MEGLNICLGCKHLGKVALDLSKIEFDGTQAPACTAFPDGIPNEIYYNGFDHRNRFAEENIFFELNDTPDEIENARHSLNLYDKIIRESNA